MEFDPANALPVFSTNAGEMAGRLENLPAPPIVEPAGQKVALPANPRARSNFVPMLILQNAGFAVVDSTTDGRLTTVGAARSYVDFGFGHRVYFEDFE